MTHERTPEQIQAEIEVQRQQLSRTVEELTDRLDVKARARAEVAHVKHSVTTRSGTPRPELVAAAGALLAVALVLVVRRSRR